jgi:hypothetical protein
VELEVQAQAQDLDVTTHWSRVVTLKSKWKSYSKGKGIMYGDNNDDATYIINGLSKQNSQTGSSGMSMVSTYSNQTLQIFQH